MTDILSRWLNLELRLSQVSGTKTISRDFSNGYLIGEILHKYNLQNDFNLFINDDNSTSKVNNFSRLEPTLQALGISFDATTSLELMQEKQGVATHLLYELYVTLKKKKKVGGTLISARMRKEEQDLFSNMLHRGIGLDANIKLGNISNKTEDTSQQLNHTSLANNAAQQRKSPTVKNIQNKGKINVTTTVRTTKSLQGQRERQQRKEKQAQIVQNEIQQFEAHKRNLFTSTSSDFPLEDCDALSETHGLIEAMSLPQLNIQYFEQIRQRRKEDTLTREQRDKRAAQFLVEQLKASEAVQNAQYEELLVKRLTRKTKEEERLVSQLLQIRSQKEVFLKNRLFREQQIQTRRDKDFQEALEREAALAHQERLDRTEKIQGELDLCKKLEAERKQNRYKKHFETCKKVMAQIVDLATKTGDYHLLTGNLIPGRQMREWKELLFSGLPLYEDEGDDKQLSPVEVKKQDKLNDHDYKEYKNMVGEWALPESSQPTKLPPKNNIIEHVILRLQKICSPAHFNLKACVLGKMCSGKTTCLNRIAEAHGLHVLSIDKLVKEALEAYNNNKGVLEQKDIENKHRSTQDNQDLPAKTAETKLSSRAKFGKAADKAMREGKAVPNEILVDIITEAIRRIPANSGWILDGFPMDISQAYLLEEALGGDVDEVTNNQTDLTVDTDPTKPPQAPALDLALLFETSDECAASRAANKTDGNTLSVIPSRIAAFQDTWSELEEWFGRKQDILVHVDANLNEEELFKAVESILLQVLKQPPEGSINEPSVSNETNLSYVDEPLPSGIAESLYPQCHTVHESYVNKIKAELQDLRLQSTSIDLHLFNVREEFKQYLSRTDLKQDLISQWQKDFNSISHEETKAELHQRLEDLLEQLWDISDTRTEENEQKMAGFMENEWFEDLTAVLLKHHSNLIQAEVEQFQDKLSVLKAYYHSMCKETLPQPESNFDLQVQQERMLSKTHSHEQTEHVKPQHESLISEYEEALSTISNLLSAETQLCKIEIKQPWDGEEEKNPCPSADRDPNSPSSNQTSCSHKPSDFNSLESSSRSVQNKIYDEHVAALKLEGDITKAHIALIKSHGLKMVDSLQSRVEQIVISMKKMVEEQFVAEMKSIEHVAELVRHHIESDPKLQDKLGLDCTDYYQNEYNQIESTPPEKN